MRLSADAVIATALTVGGGSAILKEFLPDASLAAPLLAVAIIWFLALVFGYAVAYLNGEQFSKDKFLRSCLRLAAYLALPLLASSIGVLYKDAKAIVPVLQWGCLGAAGAVEGLSLLKQFTILGVPLPPQFKALLLGKYKETTEEEPQTEIR
jgi:hypothetical protein